MNDSWRFYLWRADEKYKEAVAVAVEACADDTKGQTCYSAHPVTAGIVVELREARAELLRARRRFTASETPSPRGLPLRPLFWRSLLTTGSATR